MAHSETSHHARTRLSSSRSTAMLNFDSTHAPETPQDFRQLVEAIHTAGSEDETDWLEWKSHLDFSQSKDRFSLAKAVLGMANRQPEAAEQHCQGFGYIVLGIEPSNHPGVSRIDPAEITDGLELYLGVDGPQWNHHYVEYHGCDVLIVSVIPPKQGDGLFCLMRTYNHNREGTIYVRRTGKTEPAKPQDIRYLEERARRGRLDISLEVSDAAPLPWVDTDELTVTIDRILERLRQRLLQPIGRQQSRAGQEPSLTQADTGLASLQNSLRGIARAMENRSESEYREQVETWATAWRRDAEDATIIWCAKNCGAARVLRVCNLTPQNLRELQVELVLPKCLVGPVGELTLSVLPEPPAIFGSGLVTALARPLPVAFPCLTSVVEYDPPDIWVEESDERVNLIWDVGDVRPYATRTSDEFYLAVVSRTSHGTTTSDWCATAKNIDDQQRGILALPMSEEGVDLTALAEHLEHQTTAQDSRN